MAVKADPVPLLYSEIDVNGRPTSEAILMTEIELLRLARELEDPDRIGSNQSGMQGRKLTGRR